MRQENKNLHKHRTRHGDHQKRTGKFMKVYSPYLPLILLVLTSAIMLLPPSRSKEIPAQKSGVLAYATQTSISGLLGETNQRRSAGGLSSLTINSQLMSAAQAKANDMATRNYWSHDTPDGSPPWVFISNAGYSYSLAGENLAYGQLSSTQTVNEWMNSQTHRENIMNSGYIDVGFGIANAANYNGKETTGSEETIVVAMYGAPYTVTPATAQSTKPVAKSTPKSPLPASAPTTSTPQAPTQQPVAIEAVKKPTTATSTSTSVGQKPAILATSTSVTTNRLQALLQSNLPWLSSILFALSLSGGLIVLGKHGLAFHKLIVHGERYVLQHTLFDLTIVSLIGFSVIASHGVGVVL